MGHDLHKAVVNELPGGDHPPAAHGMHNHSFEFQLDTTRWKVPAGHDPSVNPKHVTNSNATVTSKRTRIVLFLVYLRLREVYRFG